MTFIAKAIQFFPVDFVRGFLALFKQNWWGGGGGGGDYENGALIDPRVVFLRRNLTAPSSRNLKSSRPYLKLTDKLREIPRLWLH